VPLAEVKRYRQTMALGLKTRIDRGNVRSLPTSTRSWINLF
jgi:hypothetical protein